MAAEVPRPPAPRDGTYLLWQRFRYEYATPVRNLRHRLVVVPRAVHGHQRRVDHRVAVSGSPALVSVSSDSFGNYIIEARAAEVATEIEFATWALVERTGPGGEADVPVAAMSDQRLLRPSVRTKADPLLADAARELAAGGGGVGFAERACSWAHAALTYQYGVTGVHTLAFDPTHDRRAGLGYLTVAVGRDCAGVAPTSGTFEGDGPGVLSGRKRLVLVDRDTDPASAPAVAVAAR